MKAVLGRCLVVAFTCYFTGYLPIEVAHSENARDSMALDMTLVSRYFQHESLYEGAERHATSLRIEPEYSRSWHDGDYVMQFSPYISLNSPDSEASHIDLREAAFLAADDNIEWRVGISTVFWGVTESVHLVDIINQTDLVESFDGEDKLGQPMINTTLQSDYGAVSLFILPYFRERTFPGKRGRLRGPMVVDVDKPHYQSREQEHHVDLALRWSHSIDDIDIGISYFDGTDRSPLFIREQNSLRPYYRLIQQWGLDLQYVTGQWLLKLESIHKSATLADSYSAAVTGFEYSHFSEQWNVEFGYVYEYLFDERGQGASSGFNDHSFFALRIDFANASSSELLMGTVVDNNNLNLSSFRIEGSKRLGADWTVEINAFCITDNDGSSVSNVNNINSALYPLRHDDYVEFSLTRYW
jgi:hypothetical protein